MRDFIPIGRFAQITRLTIKALHIYDAIGLLRPVFVDGDSGYRYYSITQLTMARKIRLLRSIDMPLDAIRAGHPVSCIKGGRSPLMNSQGNVRARCA